MDSLTDDIESILFIAREVMGAYVTLDYPLTGPVYRVPPRTSASGYKAADWNVEEFLWKGRLRVIEVGSRCDIRLEVGAATKARGDSPLTTYAGRDHRRAVRPDRIRRALDPGRARARLVALLCPPCRG